MPMPIYSSKDRPATSDGLLKLDILDGLRGIAILFVFWHHLCQETLTQLHFGSLSIDLTPIVAQGGSYGVDLFFFLSGFCLLYPYVRAHFDGCTPPTVTHFIYQRAVKILPSYLIAIFGMIWIKHIVLPPSGNLGQHIFLHLLFIHTWFSDSFTSINPIFWSLGLEVQFYAIFPLLAHCMLRKPFHTMISALIFASAARFYAMQHTNMIPGWPGHQLPMEIDPFVTGMFSAYLFRMLATKHKAAVEPARAWAWSLLAIAGVLLYILSSTLAYELHDAAYERYMLLPLDISFFAVTLGSLFGAAGRYTLLNNPLLSFYARISYNLYLWHTALRDEIVEHGVLSWSWGNTHYLLYLTLFSLLCSTLFASLLTFGIERPLMRLRPRLTLR